MTTFYMANALLFECKSKSFITLTTGYHTESQSLAIGAKIT